MELQPPQIEWWFHFIRFRRMALRSAPIASFQPLRQAHPATPTHIMCPKERRGLEPERSDSR